jgi:ABC-type antimicrobial peptide transport system permease subunit
MAQSSKNEEVWDYSELINTITDIENLLVKIFLILLAVVLLISFFSLLTTASTNILNQTKEIAILLGLGLSKTRITYIYIFEAFALVLTACLIGIFVGSVLAVLMGMQRELFGDFPV